jgi:hypothetical protein
MERIALIFLLLSCVTCGSSAEPTPTLFVLPTFARPLTPTFELPPTFTPVVTHTVTAAPTITNTPSPTPDDTLLTYANHRDDTAYVLRDVKADIDTTFGKYIEGKVSQYDAAWQAEMEVYLNEFGSIAAWFIDNPSPEAFKESHTLTLSGLLLCSVGWRYVYDGALLQDQDIYQDGVEAITACNQDWNAGDYAFWDVVLELALKWPAMSSPTVAP